MINIVCTNDTSEPLECEVEFGYVTFDGVRHDVATKAVVVAPCSKATVVAQMPQRSHSTLEGVYYAKANGQCGLASATFRASDFKSLVIPKSKVVVTDVHHGDEKVAFTVSSDKYAHAVHFGLNDDVRLSDEYFDLLPGESRRITAQGGNVMAIGDIKAGCVVNVL